MTTLTDLCAPYAICRSLLPAFPHLDAVPAPGRPGAWCVRDRELRGPFGMPPEEAALLYRLVASIAPDAVLEIGAGVGWSTAHIASTCLHVDVIDPFTEGGMADDATVNGVTQANRYARCIENLERARLHHRVHIEAAPSPDIIAAVADEAFYDLAVIDGWHLDGQPLRDVRGVLPYLSTRGSFILHDTYLPDVQAAVEWLRSERWRIIDLNTPLGMVWAIREDV